MSETLLQVENLRTYFHTFRGVVTVSYTHLTLPTTSRV